MLLFSQQEFKSDSEFFVNIRKKYYFSKILE